MWDDLYMQATHTELLVTDTCEPTGRGVIRVLGADRQAAHQMAVRVLETLDPWRREHPFPVLSREPDGQWLAVVHYRSAE